MKQQIKHIVLLGSITILIALFLRCSDSNCFTNAGKQTQKTIPISEFNTLEIQGIFMIELIPDTTNFIKIIGGSNLIEQTEIKESDSTLQCYNYSKCAIFKNHEKVQLQIHFTNIDSIAIIEACSLSSNIAITNNLSINMQADMVDINLKINNNYCKLTTQYKAGGNIILQGKSKKCTIIAQYTIKVDTRNLIVQNLNVVNSTIMDFYVNATDSLTATTTKTGKIIYYGTPEYINDLKAHGLLIKGL